MEDFVFEWDAMKAQANLNKHRVSFEEAVSIFSDPLLVTYFDDEHSRHEDRYISIGRSERDRVLLVVHTDRGDAIRLISCRVATIREQKSYEH